MGCRWRRLMVLAIGLPDGFANWLQARQAAAEVRTAEEEFVPLTPDQMNALWGVG